MSLETKFQIYKLINPDSVIGYLYIGKSSQTKQVIHISDDHISIDTIHRNDIKTYEADYIPTSQYFDFDLQFLEDLIESYIGQRDYSLCAYFNLHKEIVLAYRSIDTDICIEKELSLESPRNKTAKEIITVIHKLLSSIPR